MSSNLSATTDWDEVLKYFGFDTPRDPQIPGMEDALETVGVGGFMVLEGACGTGKTMLSLSPLIALIRDEDTPYERIVVTTSVKQQQRAFENDIETINSSLPAGTPPVSAVTLAGKADLCPYVRENVVAKDDIYGKCERSREETRDQIGAAQNAKKEAISLANEAERTPDMAEDEFSKSDINYPYVADDPELAFGHCPFYAQYSSDKMDKKGEDGEEADPSSKREQNPAIPYNLETYGMGTVDDMLQQAGEHGTCPHSVMTEAMTDAEVVIANYSHIFDPTTIARMTSDLLSDETLLICDEAHNLVSRVRRMLGETLSLYGLEQANRELTGLQALLELDDDTVDQIAALSEDRLEELQTLDANPQVQLRRLGLENEAAKEAAQLHMKIQNNTIFLNSLSEVSELTPYLKGEVNRRPLDPEDISEFIEFCEDVKRFIMKKSSEKVESFHGSLKGLNEDDTTELEVPLREPTDIAVDDLSWWLIQKNYRNLMNDLDTLGMFINHIYTYLYEEIRGAFEMPTIHSQSVGRFFNEWHTEDNTQFFREVILSPRVNTRQNGWREYYKVELALRNCIPSDKISDTLGQFGGGILMSATLAPLDIYREVTGVDKLANTRPITETVFGLSFPEQNRQTFGVNTEKFKYDRKKNAFTSKGEANTGNRVRKEYAEALRTISRETPGNVLICMPSYQEAEWAGEIIRNTTTVQKEVLVDESSEEWETESLKQKFFNGDDKVLVTSAHGTLIEGVDYDGDKLNCVAVVGVPLENSKSPYAKAVKTAYEERFGDENGYEYAFAVPAMQKARQALGRTIRSDTDVGVRLFLDERYNESGEWDSVSHLLPDSVKEETLQIESDYLEKQLQNFWNYQSQRSN